MIWAGKESCGELAYIYTHISRKVLSACVKEVRISDN